MEKKFSAMVPELTIRYNKLSDTVALAKQIGGTRDVLTDAKKSLTAFTKTKKAKNVKDQFTSAQDLEVIIGRLRSNIVSSPKLTGSEELAASMASVDTALPSRNVRDAYEEAVTSYEDSRTSARNVLSAFFGGYSAPSQLAFSTPSVEK